MLDIINKYINCKYCHESHLLFTHEGLMRNLVITGHIACKVLYITTMNNVAVCQRCNL